MVPLNGLLNMAAYMATSVVHSQVSKFRQVRWIICKYCRLSCGCIYADDESCMESNLRIYAIIVGKSEDDMIYSGGVVSGEKERRN